MVLVGAPQQVPVTFNPPALRRDDADVLDAAERGAGRRPRTAAAAAAGAAAGRRSAAAAGRRSR